jgi:hypothetical protein
VTEPTVLRSTDLKADRLLTFRRWHPQVAGSHPSPAKDDPFERFCEEVPEEPASYRSRVSGSADHRDRLRMQEVADRGCCREPLAFLVLLDGARSAAVGNSPETAPG